MTARHPLVSSLRVTAAIVVVIATVLLGLIAAHHADAAAPHALISAVDVPMQSGAASPAAGSSDFWESLASLEGCLVLLACCAIGIIVARRAVRAVATRTAGVAHVLQPGQLRRPALEPTARPSLIQLSISRR